jgi:hypothetical protein
VSEPSPDLDVDRGAGRRAPAPARVGPGAAEAISWQLADAGTRTFAEQTLEVLDARDVAERLAVRYANSDNAHRAGHMFEVMHGLSFNLDAIKHHDSARAVVTEWVPGGSQTSASDINVVHGDSVVAEAQAKLYESASGAAHELARDRYQGMQRLVAADRFDAVQSLLDRKVTLHPSGINAEHFKDAHAHVTASLHYGHVSSDPTTYADAHHAALDPTGWIDGEAHEAAAREFLAGVGAAAGVGAVLTAVVNGAGSAARVRAGDMSPAEAAITACAAAGRTMARSAGAGGIGQGLELGAHAGAVSDALSQGALPIALGRAAVGIAEAGFALAKGDIDEAEFAARAAETSTRTAVVWAFGSIGQTVIPIPVVGAMVGAFVGQMVGTQCVKGLQMAVVAARQDQADERRLRLLEAELLTAAALTEELAQLTTHLGQERNAYVATTVMPRLDAARHALLLHDDDEVLQRFGEIVRGFGREPLFTTMAEFDAWMRTDDPLVLDGNWK